MTDRNEGFIADMCLQLIDDILREALSQQVRDQTKTDGQRQSFRGARRGINKVALIASVMDLHEMRFEVDSSKEKRFVNHYAFLIKLALLLKKAIAPRPIRYWIDAFDYIHQLLRTSGYGVRSPPVATVNLLYPFTA